MHLWPPNCASFLTTVSTILTPAPRRSYERFMQCPDIFRLEKRVMLTGNFQYLDVRTSVAPRNIIAHGKNRSQQDHRRIELLRLVVERRDPRGGRANQQPHTQFLLY